MAERIARELAELRGAPLDLISAGPIGDDLFSWTGLIRGPSHSPYEGGTFRLTIRFPDDYPVKPPLIMFATPLYHPSVNTQGWICLPVLKTKWAPTLTISRVLLAIRSMLADPDPSDPLVPDIAHQFERDRAAFEEAARSWTRAHAVVAAAE